MDTCLTKEQAENLSKNNESAYILIFKTNIELKKDLAEIEICLAKLGTTINWHIDLEDADKVLRIESAANNAEQIIETITKSGFVCEELTN